MNRSGPESLESYLRRVWRYLAAIAVFAILDGIMSAQQAGWALWAQALSIVLMLAALLGLILAARRK